MAERKRYPCNVPVFLRTTVERVISFKNPVNRESARGKIRELNVNPIGSLFIVDSCLLQVCTAIFINRTLYRSSNTMKHFHFYSPLNVRSDELSQNCFAKYRNFCRRPFATVQTSTREWRAQMTRCWSSSTIGDRITGSWLLFESVTRF